MDSKQYAVFKIEDAELQKNQKVKNRLYNCVCSDETNTLTAFDPRGQHINQTLYTVLNYDKTTVCFDEPLKTRQCRSAILSYPDNTLLSFSPPKSLTPTEFKKRYPDCTEDIYINEQIEGTLLHLFYDTRIDSWEIATKKAVGGHYHTFYYKNPKVKKTTVRNMFLDALTVPHNTRFQDIEILKYLSKDYSYCFVLQHPENHIVFSITRPQLYLIAVYNILPVSRRVISIPPLMYQVWGVFDDIGLIKFPKCIDVLSYDEIDSYYQHKTDYETKGIVVTNLHNGEHFTIKNPVYEKITDYAKTYMNSLPYQYLCFRHIEKTTEFLNYYPKSKSAFDRYHKDIKDYIDGIFEFYKAKYILKENVKFLNEDKYGYIADVLHRIYLKSLSKYSEGVIKITRKMITDHLANKSPDELFYFMNYDLRRISNPYRGNQ